LNGGESDFTHATQDRDHGAPESQRRTVGPTDYDTPQYSSSSYSDTSQSFHHPRPDINTQPLTRWVYEWEDPHFYNMLLQQWQTTTAWTGQTWQDYKAEFLRVQGLNVMSTVEYQMATQMGVFPFLQRWSFITMTMVLYLYARLSLLWYCMHNYYYDTVCMQNYDIIPLVRFCDVLYIKLCIDHAKIFLTLPSVYRSNRPVTGPYRAIYRSVPNELAFQFEIWICSVFSGNRGLPTGLPKPPACGSRVRTGKVNPELSRH
jgi:hypothetical protein